MIFRHYLSANCFWIGLFGGDTVPFRPENHRLSIKWDIENAHTTIAALKMVVKNRTSEKGLIFHSARGVQYCAISFHDILHEMCPAIQQSMSRKEIVGTTHVPNNFSKHCKGSWIR